MPLPPLRPDGSLPPGQHYVTALDDVRAHFPPANARRQALDLALEDLVEVARRLGLGSQLVIDGSYTTGNTTPSDVDLAMLSTGRPEAETLRLLEVEGVDLVALDLFVLTTQTGFERWIQFFSVDRLQRPRGVVILSL